MKGEKKMKQDDLRQALIDGTIHVIAQNGLDKATTKAISTPISATFAPSLEIINTSFFHSLVLYAFIIQLFY